MKSKTGIDAQPRGYPFVMRKKGRDENGSF